MMTYLWVALALFIQFHLFYLIARLKRDFSVVDISWALGFLNVLGVGLVLTENIGLIQLVTAILVLVWGVRLGYHILARNLRQGEDWRYREMRESWGASANIQAYFKIFILQGVLLFIVSLPVSHIFLLLGESEITWTVITGASIACFGLIFEIISDHQLKKHIENKRGGFCQSGLWAYSRHPNYFGEALFWWGIALMATHQWWHLYVFVGPLLLTLFLLYVSGIPLIEKKYDQKYADNPSWWQYKARTSVFIPWRKA